jgi:hypothetical protein
MKEVYSSETLEKLYQTTWHHIQEGSTPQFCRMFMWKNNSLHKYHKNNLFINNTAKRQYSKPL